MKVSELKAWVDSIEDGDLKVPPGIVLAVVDQELEERLMHLLSMIFIYAPEPFKSEAIALTIRLMIPE